MKKRIAAVLCVVLGVLLLTGAVYAANPIKIFVNGTQAHSDVAPFLQNGRTMVPLRVISESLGADVQWDNATQTVFITENTKRNLKLYSKISNHYHNLALLGINLQNLDQFFYLAIENINLKKSTNGLNTAIERFNGVITQYNDIIQPTQDLITEANTYNIDVSKMNNILTQYSQAIDDTRLAQGYANSFYNTGSIELYTQFFSSKGSAFLKSSGGTLDSLSEYKQYHNKTQNY